MIITKSPLLFAALTSIFFIIIVAIWFFVTKDKFKEEILSMNSDQTATIDVDITGDVKALGYSGQQKITFDKAGNIYVVYRKKDDKDYNIYLAMLKRTSSGYKKGKITRVSYDEETQRVPSIYIDKKDIIHIVWYGLTENSDGRQIFYAKSDNYGDSFTKPLNISKVKGGDEQDYWQEHPQIVGDNKNLYVVWEGKDLDHDKQQVKWSKSVDDGNNWSDWTNIEASADSTQSRPSVHCTENDTCYLYFYSSKDALKQTIVYAIKNKNDDSFSISENYVNDLFDNRHISGVTFANNNYIAYRSYDETVDRSSIIFKADKNSSFSLNPDLAQYQFFPTIAARGNTAYIAYMASNESSDVPREDPRPSRILLQTIDTHANTITDTKEITTNGTYPNIAQKGDILALVYEQEHKDEYKITVNILKVAGKDE